MLKTVVLHNIFVETMIPFIFQVLWWIESSKEQLLFHLFEIEIFCNIVFVTFDQFDQCILDEYKY